MTFLRGLLVAGVAVGLLGFGSTDAFAADKKKYNLTAKTGKKLEAVVKLVEEENLAEARERLMDLARNESKYNSYEVAKIYQFLGTIAANEEKYAESAQFFQKCVDQDALAPTSQQQVIFTLAQLHLHGERFEDVVKTLKMWFRQNKRLQAEGEAKAPQGRPYYLLGISYYQLDKKDSALRAAQRILQVEDKPKETWIRFLVQLYIERENWEAALPLVKRLVSMNPGKKVYWIQLASIYMSLGQDANSLAAQQIAYSHGLLTTGRELTRLAEMYFFQELPFLCAKVMEKGFEDESVDPEKKSYELLANCWLAAREDDLSLPPLKQAAALAEEGDLFVRLSQVYVQREEWEPAEEALRKALDKGSLKDACNAHVLLGMVSFYQEQVQSAKASFGRAKREDEKCTAADHWLDYLERIRKQEEQQIEAEAEVPESEEEQAETAEKVESAESVTLQGG